MTKRRSRGEGGLHWDKSRQRWVATVTVGYDGRGKRLVKKASGKTKTEAKDKLKEMLRDLDDGLPVASNKYTVRNAVDDWLRYGLSGRDKATVDNYQCLAETHIVPNLGARKLRDLTADDVDIWLNAKASELSTRTLRLLHSILNRAVRHAEARTKVKRNVVGLCDVPTGQAGRPSKSLTLEQAEAVLGASEASPLHAYIVLSLLIGARTEELRALTWDHVALDSNPDANPPVVPSIKVWRSVRTSGDTKTRKSRRTLALPARCVVALAAHRACRGSNLRDCPLVFASAAGTELDSHNVRRAFRKVVREAGLPPMEWTPREMRHSFVSLLSDSGVPLEDIARLCGHVGTAVTESVYRHQIRPVLIDGARAMDRIFPSID
jgi:integrase